MTQAKHPADPTPPTLEGKLALLGKLRDELGSGDTIRRLFFGDLEPIALQPGGANTVVHLYNKANNVTIAYCVSPIVFPTMYFWLPAWDKLPSLTRLRSNKRVG